MSATQSCLLALGGNLEVTAETFRQVCAILSQNGVQVLQLSSFYRTAAVGVHAGAEFLNAAAVAVTQHGPAELLRILHRIEHQFGRERSVHWGPRTLDLDLILFGATVLDQPEIVVPHPAMWYRRFVLQPAAEIAAEMLHPLLRQTVQELWHRLQMRPLNFQVCSSTKASTTITIQQRDAERSVDFNTLEVLCCQWNLKWSVDQVRFTASSAAEVIVPSETFAVIRLASPDSDVPATPRLCGQPPLRSEFLLDLILNDSIDQSVNDIVTAALG